MVANRLKNLVSLTREAVRDARQVIDEVLANLGTSHHPPQPALVRVPVRNTPSARNLGSPFNNNSYRLSYRSFSTAAVRKTPTFNKFIFHQQNATRFSYSKRIPKNFGNQFWSYSAFRRPLGGSGQFPHGLYRNFVGLNARNFSTYGGNFSREAVQNLTTGLRCFLNNGGDLGSKVMKQKTQSDNFHMSLNNDEQEGDLKIFKLAKCESTGIEKCGAYVEFKLPSLELSIPTLSFINDEILDAVETSFEEAKAQIDRTNANIFAIFDSFGSLPIERRRDSIRVHFPNLDALELEKFLIESEIYEGLVYTNDDVIGMIDDELGASTESESLYSLGDYTTTSVPGLMSTDSESSVESERFFFPVLSSGTPSSFSDGPVLIGSAAASLISV